jgi:nucleoside-diphosphate-sugar epimerase
MQTNESVKTPLRVLITGDKGFVGTETTKLFKKRDIEVIGYDIMDGYDIRDYSQLEGVIIEQKPKVILHLAGIARFADADKDPLLTYETNMLGTEIVAKLASEYHVPLVFASTGSVYMPIKGIPPITEDFPAIGNSVYGCSKAIGEKIIQNFKNPYIFLRYAHLYGKEKRHHGLIGGFIERINRGLAPTLYGGKQSNDFTYIADVAEANFLAVTAPWDKWYQAYNIGTGEELTAEEAGKIVCDVVGYKGDIEVKEARGVDPMRFVYDMTKAKVMLGFTPKYSFKEGLAEMFKD